MVTVGYKWLRGLMGVTGGYELKRVVTRRHGVTGVTLGYSWLQVVRSGYGGLWG